MLFHERNDWCIRVMNTASARRCQHVVRAHPGYLHPRMVSTLDRRGILGSEIEKQDLHPIDEALRKYAGESQASAVTLTAHDEDYR
jgi:hypothetical protein